MKFISVLFIIIYVSFLLTACDSGNDGGGDTPNDSPGTGDQVISSAPEHIADAVENAGNYEKTFLLASSSGSFNGIRDNMNTHFPLVADLVNGGGEARDFMLQSFQGTSSFSEDMKLSIYAYALEQMGDSSAVTTLQDFLKNTIYMDLYLAPHLVTHAIKSLLNHNNLEWTIYYTGLQMDAAVSGNSGAQINAAISENTYRFDYSKITSNKTIPLCTRRYIIVDNNLDPLIYPDTNEQVIIEGTEYVSPDVPSGVATMWRNRVENAGDTTWIDDGEFRGTQGASRQYNCGGYAFRDLNGYRMWTYPPSGLFPKLLDAGLLIKIEDDEDIQIGDKVFYYKSHIANDSPDHVAEVSNVEESWIGWTYNTITVRNADNQSGLFESDIDGNYFLGTDSETGKVRYPTRRVYRWVNGTAPKVIPDASPSIVGNPRYCQEPECGSGRLYYGEGTVEMELTRSADSDQGAGSVTCSDTPFYHFVINDDGRFDLWVYRCIYPYWEDLSCNEYNTFHSGHYEDTHSDGNLSINFPLGNGSLTAKIIGNSIAGRMVKTVETVYTETTYTYDFTVPKVCSLPAYYLSCE